MAFVTFNVMWGHIILSYLNISSISPTICNFMSKVSTIKTMTIKEIYIHGSEWCSLWCSPSEFLPWQIMIMIDTSCGLNVEDILEDAYLSFFFDYG
jgi:hypothetical protein